MGEVQLCQRKGPNRDEKQPKMGLLPPSPWFGQFAGNGRILRRPTADQERERECPDRGDWRREAHSPQTFFSRLFDNEGVRRGLGPANWEEPRESLR
jgi:hypothetical protein